MLKKEKNQVMCLNHLQTCVRVSVWLIDDLADDLHARCSRSGLLNLQHKTANGELVKKPL